MKEKKWADREKGNKRNGEVGSRPRRGRSERKPYLGLVWNGCSNGVPTEYILRINLYSVEKTTLSFSF